MLDSIGLGSAEELFDSIPPELLLKRPLNTPAALSEIELLDRFEKMGSRNTGARRTSFMGGGAYSHYIPTIVDHILSRSEFFTAYTPYQPEISQGTLQTIFEFQTLVCQLTGMEVANASMYDGSTALAEAVLMAERVTKRSKAIASSAAHPQYLEVIRTYVQHAGIHLELVPFDEQTQASRRSLWRKQSTIRRPRSSFNHQTSLVALKILQHSRMRPMRKVLCWWLRSRKRCLWDC